MGTVKPVRCGSIKVARMSQRHPLTARGRAAGNPLVLGYNRDAGKGFLQAAAHNAIPARYEERWLYPCSPNSLTQLQLHPQFLLHQASTYSYWHKRSLILLTFKSSAAFKHLRIHIKNVTEKSISCKMWGSLSQTHSSMMTSCEELL